MQTITFPRLILGRGSRPKLSSSSIGAIALGISITSASTFNAFAKDLTNVFSPLALLFFSEILTAFFVLLSFGAVPTLKKLIHAKRKAFLPLLVFAMLSGVMGPLLWFMGLHSTSAINASLFGRMDLVFLTLMAAFLLEEHITRWHLAAIATTMMGVIFIALEGFTKGITWHLGDLIIIAATLSFAMGSIVVRLKLKHIQPHLVLLSKSTFAIVFFFLLSPFISHPFISEIKSFPMVLIPTLLGFAFISRFMNGFAYYQAIDRLPISTISIVSLLDIFGSLLFSYWYLGEPILWFHMVGGALVISGAVLLEIMGTHANTKELTHHMKHRVR